MRLIIIIIIIITMTMFMVLSSRHSHCESSLGSFDECRLSAGWPPTLRPNQPIWAASPPIGCYHPQTPSPFIIITQLSRTHAHYFIRIHFRIHLILQITWNNDHKVSEWANAASKNVYIIIVTVVVVVVDANQLAISVRRLWNVADHESWLM